MALYYLSKATNCAISAWKRKREYDGGKYVHGSLLLPVGWYPAHKRPSPSPLSWNFYISPTTHLIHQVEDMPVKRITAFFVFHTFLSVV